MNYEDIAYNNDGKLARRVDLARYRMKLISNAGKENLTQKEIGIIFKITPARVGQLLAKCKRLCI